MKYPDSDASFWSRQNCFKGQTFVSLICENLRHAGGGTLETVLTYSPFF